LTLDLRHEPRSAAVIDPDHRGGHGHAGQARSEELVTLKILDIRGQSDGPIPRTLGVTEGTVHYRLRRQADQVPDRRLLWYRRPLPEPSLASGEGRDRARTFPEGL
jgi:hypothetical protein